MPLNLRITILIICIESKKIKTEEIYFRNSQHKNDSSFKKDKKILKRMHLKNLFFRSFNIIPNQKKFKIEMGKLKAIDPMFSKIFFICDRDTESYKDSQIQGAIKFYEPSLKQTFKLSDEDIIYLEYAQPGDNFESFLDLHFDKKDRALFWRNYRKTNRNLYAKTMQIGGKNFGTLTSNLDKYQKTWQKLFKIHEQDDLE